MLKTYKRKDTKFQPLVFTAVVGFVLVALLIALVIRSTGHARDVAQGRWPRSSLVRRSPGPATRFFAMPNSKRYQGTSLIIRSIACGLVYALLWGVFGFLGDRFFGPDAMKKGLEIWQMVVLVVPVFAAGTLAAYASFDLDPGSAFFHCAMYFAVTVMLRLVAGLPAVPGLGSRMAKRQSFEQCSESPAISGSRLSSFDS